jgi:restriction endonuclease
MTIPQTIIRFPEIKLHTRDAHKLRGYFGNLFKEKSELLHNHMGNGNFRYDYPQVQYKVIDQTPLLVALKDGAELLPELFLKIKELKIGQEIIPVHQKNIEAKELEIGATDSIREYEFQTLWMSLNQKNHLRYENSSSEKRKKLLKRILIGNFLSFFKGMDHFVETQIEVDTQFLEKQTRFKNNTMLAFEGSFKTNLALPDLIGLGKSVARGFGTIKQV